MRIEINTVKGNNICDEQQKKYTVVFFDYESLYWSFIKQYSVPPDLNTIIKDVKQTGKIYKIKVYGDFSKAGLDKERDRIRTITSDIIDCAKSDKSTQKEYTDFIMLDHIYQEVIQNPSVEQFILFTGDGHFSSVVTFLRMFMDKIVGVYGIRQTLSRQLADCASWVKIINVFDVNTEEYQLKLIRNFETANKKGIILTFMKTIEHTAEMYGGTETKYQNVLSDMIENGYVVSEMTPLSISNPPFKMIVPQWDKLSQLKSRIVSKIK